MDESQDLLADDQSKVNHMRPLLSVKGSLVNERNTTCWRRSVTPGTHLLWRYHCHCWCSMMSSCR